MNIGAELPYRRKRFAQRTGSLIFDRQLAERLRKHEAGADDVMHVWSNGHFRST